MARIQRISEAKFVSSKVVSVSDYNKEGEYVKVQKWIIVVEVEGEQVTYYCNSQEEFMKELTILEKNRVDGVQNAVA